MKTRHLLTCVMILACAPLANAYNDNDARKAVQPTINTINERLNRLQSSTAKTDDDLSRQIKELRDSVSELQNKVDGLWKTGATNLENIGRKGDKADIKANVALWISVPIVMVICGVVCLVFWPKKTRAVAINSASTDKNKCPRCGWEHDPRDIICKNPECKTQF